MLLPPPPPPPPPPPSLFTVSARSRKLLLSQVGAPQFQTVRPSQFFSFECVAPPLKPHRTKARSQKPEACRCQTPQRGAHPGDATSTTLICRSTAASGDLTSSLLQCHCLDLTEDTPQNASYSCHPHVLYEAQLIGAVGASQSASRPTRCSAPTGHTASTPGSPLTAHCRRTRQRLRRSGRCLTARLRRRAPG